MRLARDPVQATGRVVLEDPASVDELERAIRQLRPALTDARRAVATYFVGQGELRRRKHYRAIRRRPLPGR